MQSRLDLLGVKAQAYLPAWTESAPRLPRTVIATL